MPDIGSLNEKPLHAGLKAWYRRPGDLVEEPVEEFVADLVREGLLIEIQTKGFSSMRNKLDRLLDAHPMLLVHPVAAVKWIVKLDDQGQERSRRRSPKRGGWADVCAELVSFPSLLSHPHLSLEVLLVEEEEIRRPDAKRGRRRGGFVIEERRLVDVLDSIRFETPRDLLQLLPPELPDEFTTQDLADRMERPRRLAQQVAYCLRESGAIELVGLQGRSHLYRVPA